MATVLQVTASQVVLSHEAGVSEFTELGPHSTFDKLKLSATTLLDCRLSPLYRRVTVTDHKNTPHSYQPVEKILRPPDCCFRDPRGTRNVDSNVKEGTG